MRKKRSRTSYRNEADRLFSLQVRARGHCEAAGFDDVGCKGDLQCAHLAAPRRYLSVRWNPANAAALCGAHHMYMTHFPLAHERFCRGYMGDDMYEQIRFDAEAHHGAPNYLEVLERLKGVTTTHRNH